MDTMTQMQLLHITFRNRQTKLLFCRLVRGKLREGERKRKTERMSEKKKVV